MIEAEDTSKESRGTVSLADEEAVKQIVVNAVFGLWDLVNELTCLRPSKQERYRVTIFGSARAQPGTLVYEEVKRVGTVLELMMIWQLLQVRHVQETPLILVGKTWPELVNWARTHFTCDAAAVSQRRGSRHPALCRHRGSSHRTDSRASRTLDGQAESLNRRWKTVLPL